MGIETVTLVRCDQCGAAKDSKHAVEPYTVVRDDIPESKSTPVVSLFLCGQCLDALLTYLGKKLKRPRSVPRPDEPESDSQPTNS